MVVSGRDVGDEGSENVERGPVAEPLLELYVHGDLVQGDVSRAFHHVLDACGPGALDEMPEGHELGDLRLIGRIIDASGPESVS